ncbi:MAG: NAD regulator [Hyphomonadaceae bacterium]
MIAVVLSAVIFAVDEDDIYGVVTRGAGDVLPGLPFGELDAEGEPRLEQQLRQLVRVQTGFDPPYAEQLYTFGDRGRDLPLVALAGDAPNARILSVGYMALAKTRAPLEEARASWRGVYEFFPWEDWREGRPAFIDNVIAKRLKAWAESGGEGRERWTRACVEFGFEGAGWNEERALQRYELLYEAGLVFEAVRDRAKLSRKAAPEADHLDVFGQPMESDGRRVLATGLSRIRAKIKYRPIIFDVVPAEFTLRLLQKLVESIAGLTLHQSNFRRLLKRTGLVTQTNKYDGSAGGRPAMLYRVAQEALSQRPIGGINVPAPRGGPGDRPPRAARYRKTT